MTDKNYALEALESAIDSFENGYLDGWELQLVKRRIIDIQERQAVDVESLKDKTVDALKFKYYDDEEDIVGKVIDHLAAQGFITCKENAKNFTHTDGHVKETGNSLDVNSLKKPIKLKDSPQEYEHGYNQAIDDMAAQGMINAKPKDETND